MEGSFAAIEELYGKSNFNETAKFEILKKAANNILNLSAMAIYPGTKSFEGLKMVVVDFDKGIRIYLSLLGAHSKRNQTKKCKEPKKRSVQIKMQQGFLFDWMQD